MYNLRTTPRARNEKRACSAAEKRRRVKAKMHKVSTRIIQRFPEEESPIIQRKSTVVAIRKSTRKSTVVAIRKSTRKSTVVAIRKSTRKSTVVANRKSTRKSQAKGQRKSIAVNNPSRPMQNHQAFLDTEIKTLGEVRLYTGCKDWKVRSLVEIENSVCDRLEKVEKLNVKTQSNAVQEKHYSVLKNFETFLYELRQCISDVTSQLKEERQLVGRKKCCVFCNEGIEEEDDIGLGDSFVTLPERFHFLQRAASSVVRR